MQYRTYGKTGKKVSALGFGLMRLPMDGDHVDMDVAVELIRRAIELGVNYLDSAVGYCNAESQVAFGRSIEGLRDRVYVSTKNHYKGADGDEWQRNLDDSLDRIGVDVIDFYHLHGLSWDEYNGMLGADGPIDRFRRAKDEGVIRHKCFSCHDAPENMLKLIDTGEFEGMLLQYNLLDRRNEDVIAHAHAQGLGVAIMGPVGGGRLVAPSDQIQGLVRGSQSTPEVALRFVMANPNVTVALSGMGSMAMVEENAATAAREEPLNAAEREQVVASLADTQELMDLYCTGCGYCVPCPNDVDVPENFRLMNLHRVFGLTDHARDQYEGLGKKRKGDAFVEAWAAACLQCGECEPKCLQNIPIIAQLEETHAALGAA